MTAEPVRALTTVYHEMPVLNELVQVEIKRLDRIPDGGDHCVHGRVVGRRNIGVVGRRYAYLYHAVDSYTCVVYSEIVRDQREVTSANFWIRF